MMKVILPLCCLFLLAGCSTTTVTHPGLRAADLAAGRGEPLRGEEGNRLEDLPVPALVQQGRGYLSTGNLSLARIHLLAALKKDPQAAAAYVALGDLQMKSGHAEAARIAYRTALDKQPDCVPALIALGRLHRQAADPEGALEILRQARQLAPADAEILSELAITLDAAERYAEAEPLHRQAAQLRPTQAAPCNNLGFHYLQQKRYPEAITALRQALRRNPLDGLAQNNLAVALVLNGETELAFELFRRTVGAAAAWNNIGYLYMTQGKRQPAEKAFRLALDLNPRFYAVAKRNLEILQQRKAEAPDAGGG